MARPSLCISGDSHVVESAEVFNGLPERFGDAAPRMVFDPERGDMLQVGQSKNFPVGRFGIAGHFANDPETQEMIKMGYSGLRPGILDPMARLKDQDIDGLDAEVLLPSVMFGVYPLVRRRDRGCDLRELQRLDRQLRLAGPEAPVPDGLHPAARHRQGHRGAAARQEHGPRRREHPLRASGRPPVLQPRVRPLLGRGRGAGHAAGHARADDGAARQGLPAHWGPIMGYCLWPTAIAFVMGDIISSGVPARFPKLQFVPTEWETGWMAHFLQRLDWSSYRVPRNKIPPRSPRPPATTSTRTSR